jgi:hypothetical protein
MPYPLHHDLKKRPRAWRAFNHGYTFLLVTTLVWRFFFNLNARRHRNGLKRAKATSGPSCHVALEFRLYTRAVRSRRICTLIVAPVNNAHSARELANSVHPDQLIRWASHVTV